MDAAWAGVAFALPEYRQIGRLVAINKFAHSFCTNFHKVSHPNPVQISPCLSYVVQWGLTVFDCSTFWVKDRLYLTEALDVTPEFLRTRHGDTGMHDASSSPAY